MSDLITEARELKSRAMDARDRGDFTQAIQRIQTAEHRLRDALEELKANRERTSEPGRFEQDLANQLIHILGSKGGILRRKGTLLRRKGDAGADQAYAESAVAYSAGYTFEEQASKDYGILSSYNLTQRLVARIFIRPEAVSDEAITILDLPVRQKLRAAKEEIKRQLNGKRSGDEYAAADLAMICVLLGEEWESALDEFIAADPEPYALKVTLELFEELREAAEASLSAPSELKKRLIDTCDELAHAIG